MPTDPLRFMAGLETLASTDYSLCIKAGVHFTLCGGMLPLVVSCAQILFQVQALAWKRHISQALHTSPQDAFSTQTKFRSDGCAGTIAKLGTKKHHTEFLPRLDTLDLPGCFG